MSAVAFRFVDGGQCGASRCRQSAAAGDALLIDEELFDRGHRGDLGLEFGELIAQQIEARVAILGGGFQRLETPAAVPVALEEFCDLAEHPQVRQVLVQHLALRAAIHQALEFLLAMDFDEELRQFAQCLERHHLAVHIGARTAVRADHPPHHEIAVVFDCLRLEPGLRCAWKRVKTRRDFGALRALAHDVAAGAAAGNEQQRIDDDGFAGAGLAGERREAGPKFEFRLIDEHEIAQLQVGEHGPNRRRAGHFGRRTPPRPQCSFERSSR